MAAARPALICRPPPWASAPARGTAVIETVAIADAKKGMDVEKLLGECAVLGPDRRQLEQAEDSDGRPISRGGDPAGDWLHDEQGVETPMCGVATSLCIGTM